MHTYLNIFFALEINRNIFWVPTGLAPPSCPNDRDHNLPAKARYCPACGAPVLQEVEEQPTPVLATFANEIGVAPEVAFAELLNPAGGWYWTPDIEGQPPLTIYWQSVERVAGVDSIAGLGFRLCHEMCVERDTKPLTYGLTELAQYHIALLEVAKKFGIDSEPKLWVQIEQCSDTKKS